MTSGGSGASRRSLHRRTERPAIPASQARAQYSAVFTKLGLPQSATWRDWPPSDDLRMNGEGFMSAVDYAWKVWWREWVAAAKAGDRERIAAAVSASNQLHSSSRNATVNPDAEEWVALDANTLRDFERLEPPQGTATCRASRTGSTTRRGRRERTREAAGLD